MNINSISVVQYDIIILLIVAEGGIVNTDQLLFHQDNAFLVLVPDNITGQDIAQPPANTRLLLVPNGIIYLLLVWGFTLAYC